VFFTELSPPPSDSSFLLVVESIQAFVCCEMRIENKGTATDLDEQLELEPCTATSDISGGLGLVGGYACYECYDLIPETQTDELTSSYRQLPSSPNRVRDGIVTKKTDQVSYRLYDRLLVMVMG
jgi:hypothetical protein